MNEKILYILLIIFLGSLNVDAADCSYKTKAELNKEAAFVETNYEVLESEEKYTAEGNGEEFTIKNYSFKITIYNITKNLKVEIKNDFDGKVINADYYDTKDGKYSFVVNDQNNIIKYKITVYSNNGDCGNIRLKTFNFTKPKFNEYARYAVCEGRENIPYCQKFITKEYKLTNEELEKKIDVLENINETKKEQKENPFLEFIKENYIFIIAGTLVIIGGSVSVIIYRKKRII